MTANRRTFLKASLGTLGAAAFYGITTNKIGHSTATDELLANLFGSPERAYAQAGTYPANKMSAVLPTVSSEILLETPHLVKEIAPGLPYEVWTFNGRVMSVNFCKNGRCELPLLNKKKQEWRPHHEYQNSTKPEVTARIA